MRFAWLLGWAAVAALFAIDLSTTTGLSINGLALWGRDFANVYSAGRIVSEGKLAILYDAHAYGAWQSAFFGPGIADHAYSYPPISLFYAPLWGAPPYLVSLALWCLVSLAAFYFAARPWLRRAGLPAWLSLALPSTLLCIWAGHYGLIIGALWLFAFANLDRRPVPAGIAIGLMVIKPHLALLLPLVLARRGAWRAFGAAAATVVVLVGASLLAFGIEPWRAFLGTTSGAQLRLIAQSGDYFGLMMPSIATSLFGLGASAALAWIVQGAVALAAVVLLWCRMPDDAMQAGAAAVTATFLVLPYAFNYDMTAVGLAALLLAHAAVTRRDAATVAAAAPVIALPPVMMFLAMYGLRIAPLLVAALFWMLLRRPLFARDQRTTPPNAQRRLPATP